MRNIKETLRIKRIVRHNHIRLIRERKLPDEEIENCKDQFSQARRSLYESLPEDDKGQLFMAAHRIVIAMKQCNPDLSLTTFDLIDAILSAQYYARFGESPIETALKARHNQ